MPTDPLQEEIVGARRTVTNLREAMDQGRNRRPVSTSTGESLERSLREQLRRDKHASTVSIDSTDGLLASLQEEEARTREKAAQAQQERVQGEALTREELVGQLRDANLKLAEERRLSQTLRERLKTEGEQRAQTEMAKTRVEKELAEARAQMARVQRLEQEQRRKSRSSEDASQQLAQDMRHERDVALARVNTLEAQVAALQKEGELRAASDQEAAMRDEIRQLQEQRAAAMKAEIKDLEHEREQATKLIADLRARLEAAEAGGAEGGASRTGTPLSTASSPTKDAKETAAAARAREKEMAMLKLKTAELMSQNAELQRSLTAALAEKGGQGGNGGGGAAEARLLAVQQRLDKVSAERDALLRAAHRAENNSTPAAVRKLQDRLQEAEAQKRALASQVATLRAKLESVPDPQAFQTLIDRSARVEAAANLTIKHLEEQLEQHRSGGGSTILNNNNPNNTTIAAAPTTTAAAAAAAASRSRAGQAATPTSLGLGPAGSSTGSLTASARVGKLPGPAAVSTTANNHNTSTAAATTAKARKLKAVVLDPMTASLQVLLAKQYEADLYRQAAEQLREFATTVAHRPGLSADALQAEATRALSLADTGGLDYLPDGWDVRVAESGLVFYVDHNTRSTSWIHPVYLDQMRGMYGNMTAADRTAMSYAANGGGIMYSSGVVHNPYFEDAGGLPSAEHIYENSSAIIRPTSSAAVNRTAGTTAASTSLMSSRMQHHQQRHNVSTPGHLHHPYETVDDLQMMSGGHYDHDDPAGRQQQDLPSPGSALRKLDKIKQRRKQQSSVKYLVNGGHR